MMSKFMYSNPMLTTISSIERKCGYGIFRKFSKLVSARQMIHRKAKSSRNLTHNEIISKSFHGSKMLSKIEDFVSSDLDLNLAEIIKRLDKALTHEEAAKMINLLVSVKGNWHTLPELATKTLRQSLETVISKHLDKNLYHIYKAISVFGFREWNFNFIRWEGLSPSQKDVLRLKQTEMLNSAVNSFQESNDAESLTHVIMNFLQTMGMAMRCDYKELDLDLQSVLFKALEVLHQEHFDKHIHPLLQGLEHMNFTYDSLPLIVNRNIDLAVAKTLPMLSRPKQAELICDYSRICPHFDQLSIETQNVVITQISHLLKHDFIHHDHILDCRWLTSNHLPHDIGGLVLSALTELSESQKRLGFYSLKHVISMKHLPWNELSRETRYKTQLYLCAELCHLLRHNKTSNSKYLDLLISMRYGSVDSVHDQLYTTVLETINAKVDWSALTSKQFSMLVETLILLDIDCKNVPDCINAIFKHFSNNLDKMLYCLTTLKVNQYDLSEDQLHCFQNQLENYNSSNDIDGSAVIKKMYNLGRLNFIVPTAMRKKLEVEIKQSISQCNKKQYIRVLHSFKMLHWDWSDLSNETADLIINQYPHNMTLEEVTLVMFYFAYISASSALSNNSTVRMHTKLLNNLSSFELQPNSFNLNNWEAMLSIYFELLNALHGGMQLVQASKLGAFPVIKPFVQSKKRLSGFEKVYVDYLVSEWRKTNHSYHIKRHTSGLKSNVFPLFAIVFKGDTVCAFIHATEINNNETNGHNSNSNSSISGINSINNGTQLIHTIYQKNYPEVPLFDLPVAYEKGSEMFHVSAATMAEVIIHTTTNK